MRNLGQLINTNTNQNSASLLPRVPQNIQLANPGIHQIRPVVSPVTMAPGQITLATGGMGIRPGITMASVIRPALQFQTINSPTVPGGQTKVGLDKVGLGQNIFICCLPTQNFEARSVGKKKKNFRSL